MADVHTDDDDGSAEYYAPANASVEPDGYGNYVVCAVDPTRAGERIPGSSRRWYYPKRRFPTLEKARAYEAECASGEHLTGINPLYSHARGASTGVDSCYGYRVLLRREGKNARRATFHKRDYGGDLARTLAAAQECRRSVLASAPTPSALAASTMRPDQNAPKAHELVEDARARAKYSVENRPKGLLFEHSAKHYRFRVLCDRKRVKRKYDDFNVKKDYGGNENAAFADALGHWRYVQHERTYGSGRIGAGLGAGTAAAQAQAGETDVFIPDDGSDGNPDAQGSSDESDSVLNPYDDNDPL